MSSNIINGLKVDNSHLSSYFYTDLLQAIYCPILFNCLSKSDLIYLIYEFLNLIGIN